MNKELEFLEEKHGDNSWGYYPPSKREVAQWLKEWTEKQFAIHGVVSSAFLVQHKETLINYGLFSTREKAEKYINKNTDLFGIQEVKIA